jgi:hypothetical protein
MKAVWHMTLEVVENVGGYSRSSSMGKLRQRP